PPDRASPDHSTHRMETWMPRTDQATRLVHDMRRIAAVAGPSAALRYGAAIVRHAPTICRTGSLDAADRAMANRDWTFRPLPGVQVILPGSAFGDAREMYCRGAYTALPGYAPAPGEIVVDLGANQGLFSLLAARVGADVIAVEAQRGFASTFVHRASGSGVSNRIQLLHALVGTATGVLAAPRARENASHWDDDWDDDVDVLTMAEVFEAGGIDQVDLMRIDIAGSEFVLFDEPGWLDAVGRIVMKVHTGFGDPRTLVDLLIRCGFEATLLDNDLTRSTHLSSAASGYLYARRRGRTPQAREAAGHHPDAAQSGSGPIPGPGLVSSETQHDVSA
uniref:FkbM family methyltransferase n=1 Tax=Frankia tisae TaxID=2950104 RepID=UPI0021BE9752